MRAQLSSRISMGCAVSGLGLIVGCIGNVIQPNPFLSLTEDILGVAQSTDTDTGGGGGTGAALTAQFRRTQTITLANQDDEADLNVSFAAWITVGSLRTAEQLDQLIANGYVQLSREVTLGTITLPPGTLVFGGPGVGGATPVVVSPGTTRTFSLISPDRVLLFSSPPVSCDTVAFFFSINGELVRTPDVPADTAGGLFEGATGSGPRKTLAQFNVYQCDPLSPGLFLKTGGGLKRGNEYFEGEAVRVDFLLDLPNVETSAAVVTIGS